MAVADRSVLNFLSVEANVAWWNATQRRPLSGMGKQVTLQITAEIQKIEQEISAQKKIIKASLGNTLAIEAAEHELKALHTRKDVLTANLRKLEPDLA